MASTKRSSSLEYIELISASPTPLDSSVSSSTTTTIQRESQLTDEKERDEDNDNPPQQRGGSKPPVHDASGVAAATGRNGEGTSSSSR